MNRDKVKFFLRHIIFLTAAFCFVLLGTAQNAQAQTFSGRAVGIDANTRVTTAAGTTVTATVLLADTGPLPPAGGTRNGGVASANVTTLGLLTTNFTTGVITTMTSGGMAGGTPNRTQSRATVNNLNLAVAGATISATNLQADTECRCNGQTPVCTGGTTVTNLVITRPGLATIILNGAVAPNTTFTTTTTATVGTVTTVTTTRIVVNEQIVTPNSITVNALHVTVTAVATDSFTGLVTTTTTDIIVAQAHSDIVCGPTAATVTVSGRVMTSDGRGIDKATVTFTNPDGEIIYALTSTFGYYTFSDVAVGNTYVLEARHKRYVFVPQVINVQNELLNLDILANGDF